MYVENLHKVLQSIYLLVSKIGFSGEYVDSLSPADRQMQIFYYEKELEEKQKSKQKSNGMPMMGSGLDTMGE